MKVLVFAGILGLSFAVFAEHHEEKKGEKLEAHKARVLEKIDKRIAAMNSHRKCVSEAKDKKSLMSCRANMKEARSEWQSERKARREKRSKK